MIILCFRKTNFRCITLNSKTHITQIHMEKYKIYASQVYAHAKHYNCTYVTKVVLLISMCVVCIFFICVFTIQQQQKYGAYAIHKFNLLHLSIKLFRYLCNNMCAVFIRCVEHTFYATITYIFLIYYLFTEQFVICRC